MLISNFLKDRRSVREFRRKKIDEKTLTETREIISETLKKTEEYKFNIVLYEDGDKIYDELEEVGGYSGVMIESPHYIGLEIIEEESKSYIYGAYYMENIMTKINKLGIEACWVTVDNIYDDKTNQSMFDNVKGNVRFMLAIGYPILRNPFIQTKKLSSRLDIEQVVYDEDVERPISLQELEERGLYELFYYVRFSPSSRNSQPWRFLLKDGKVQLLLVEENGEYSYIDAGVMMYYFQQMIILMGLNKKWELIDENYSGQKNNYKAIAEIKI